SPKKVLSTTVFSGQLPLPEPAGFIFPVADLLAVGLNHDRAGFGGAEHLRASAPIALDNFVAAGFRAVARAGGENSEPGPHAGQEFGAARGRAAVARRSHHGALQFRLACGQDGFVAFVDTAGKQMMEPAVSDSDHSGALAVSRAGRIEKAKAYALEQAARLAIVQFNARNLRPFERILEILEAAGVAFGGPGPEFLRGKFLDNRAHAAVVIDARMGHDQVIDPKNFPRAQKRRDDRLAGVEVRGG